MRTLVIAGDYPWPTDTGTRMRLSMTLRGLRRCGPTELLSVISKFRTEFGDPEQAAGLEKVAKFGLENRIPQGIGLVPTLYRPSIPLAMAWRDRPMVTEAADRFMSGRYDLIWFFGIRQWVLTGQRSSAPTVIDLDDLEDQKILARLSMPRSGTRTVTARARQLGALLVSQEEVRRWQRLQRRANRAGVTTVVCSEIDAHRVNASGVERVAVVPNGYGAVTEPVGRVAVGSPPTVLFQGLLVYPPNADAARWLALEVGPALRSLDPTVQIRLVGDHRPDLDFLGDPPRVTLTGRVAAIASELARADVVVVPLRYGSGTRLKILEAFAHGIPVVSTTLGAEGLDVVDGVHLLVADTVSGLAAACHRLLTEPELRRDIVANARTHFLERFESKVIEAQIERLARDLAESHRQH
jgi:polysaccharide biosynthesis protein PslH